MDRKSLIQVTLFIILVIFSIFFLKVFYKSDKSQTNSTDKKIVNNQIINKKNETNNNKQNLIKDIKYNSNYSGGNNFEILADYGETNIDDADLMFLTNVRATIFLDGKENVNLTSKYANFNSKTFETTFLNNVKVSRKDETITGNQLYLVFDDDNANQNKSPKKEQNILRMSQNVVFKKPGYNLNADIAELDLKTKDLKIYMYNNNQKVSIMSNLK